MEVRETLNDHKPFKKLKYTQVNSYAKLYAYLAEDENSGTSKVLLPCVWKFDREL